MPPAVRPAASSPSFIHYKPNTLSTIHTWPAASLRTLPVDVQGSKHTNPSLSLSPERLTPTLVDLSQPPSLSLSLAPVKGSSVWAVGTRPQGVLYLCPTAPPRPCIASGSATVPGAASRSSSPTGSFIIVLRVLSVECDLGARQEMVVIGFYFLLSHCVPRCRVCNGKGH